MNRDIGGLPGKSGLVVANILDRHAAEMGEVFMRHAARPASFAGQHHAIGGHQCFASDAGIGIGGQERVKHRIAQSVGNLVGMAFRDRLGSEKIFALVAHDVS